MYSLNYSMSWSTEIYIGVLTPNSGCYTFSNTQPVFSLQLQRHLHIGKMSLSTESLVAIIGLCVSIPPSVLLFWHYFRRYRRSPAELNKNRPISMPLLPF